MVLKEVNQYKSQGPENFAVQKLVADIRLASRTARTTEEQHGSGPGPTGRQRHFRKRSKNEDKVW